MSPLGGSVAVVTGSTRGIGRAIAEELAIAGARVVLTGRDARSAESAARALGPSHLGVALDVRSRDSIDAALRMVVSGLGEPSILVNNAGVNHLAHAEDFPEAAWDEVIDVNLSGLFRCCQAFGSRMLAEGAGTIVNVASITGAAVGMPWRAPYGASKAGVVGLTRVLAVEWARRGVRVNAVLPGPVRTPMVEQAIEDGFVDANAIVERTPAGRLAEPSDVAGAVLALVREDTGFVTGQTLVVDGGYSTYAAAHPVDAGTGPPSIE